MSHANFKSQLINPLEKDPRLWDKEQKKLNQTLLFDLVDKFDGTVIDLLLQNER